MSMQSSATALHIDALCAKGSPVKERPMLFNGDMVRAILSGQKTVTRRLVKGGQIPAEDTSIAIGERQRWSAIAQRDPRYGFCVFGATEAECAKELEEFAPCPYGRPGDRLWVRETTEADYSTCDSVVLSRYAADKEPVTYLADDDGEAIQAISHWCYPRDSRPSIHMTRSACRILLEITAVRVERLHDITRSDIRAEGLQCPPELAGDDTSPNYRDWYPAAWRDLWNSTGGDWDANPWVWVVEFKRVTP